MIKGNILLNSHCTVCQVLTVLDAGVKGAAWHVGFNNWHPLKKNSEN